MRFEDFLNTLNEEVKKEFTGYEADITDNLYKINFAIARGLNKIEEERQILEVKNNDVYLVEGEAQDRLYAQDFVFRKEESKAKGYWITKNSVPGTIIQPFQLKLKTNSNITFANIEKVTIEANGTAKILVECEEFGDVGNIDKEKLNEIKTPILGINTGTNELKFDGGADRENDFEFRKRYLRFRGQYSGLTKDDIQKQIYMVKGIKGVQLEENHNKDEKVLDNGLVMQQKSFIAYVDGGADRDVAKALSLKVNTSIHLYGDVEIGVWSEDRQEDEKIKFSRPSDTKIYYRYVTIGDVDRGNVDKLINDYLLNSQIGAIISSYLAEREIKLNTDDSRLISIEVEFSKDNINFQSVLRLLTGEKVREVEKNVG
ncbi:MAG: baseplate J/gp47 family protein [Cetobacterium sp.]|uniref:baseplate J/gp47 family protein n=1 Tax=Cetobacterium sp. TaxID=2071632 RepID=UPI003EE7EFA0